jgi:CarD family transcriptional regulator
MGPSLSFHIGERVVYPNHGVGTVENISTRTFGSRTERFYLLRLANNNLTVMVPFSHVNDVGLRKVTRTSEIQRVLDFLATGRCTRCADWKNRFRDNSDKMRNGELIDIADVLKGLMEQQQTKPLSFREKKMLDRARHMLVTEVSSARGVGLDTAAEILRKALGRAEIGWPEPL